MSSSAVGFPINGVESEKTPSERRCCMESNVKNIPPFKLPDSVFASMLAFAFRYGREAKEKSRCCRTIPVPQEREIAMMSNDVLIRARFEKKSPFFGSVKI